MGVSVQDHAPHRSLTQGKTPGTHFIGGWVGIRAGLDTEARGKSSASAGTDSDRPVRSQRPY
jgi:hypothetical protein